MELRAPFIPLDDDLCVVQIGNYEASAVEEDGYLKNSEASTSFDDDFPVEYRPSSGVLPPVEKPKTPPTRVNPKNMRPEFCAVCGDAASGYHYEVASCNGCKTFFRRTILGQLKYECRRNGECVKTFNKRLRLKCRSCRYDRCVSVGMNPLAMVADIKAERNPVVQNILSKRQLEAANTDNEKECARRKDAKVICQLTPSMENKIDRLVEKLLYLEMKAEKFRRSSYNPAHHFLKLDDVLLGHSKFGYNYAEVNYLQTTFPLPITDRGLSRKDDVINAEHSCTDRRPWRAKMWKVMDAICAIEYLKTLEFFHRLGDRDKKVLAKGVTFACLYLLSAFYAYSQKGDRMMFPDGSIIPIQKRTLLGCCQRGEMPPQHSFMVSRGLIQFFVTTKLDRKEYVLLKALIACNHSLHDLSPAAKQILTEERHKYAKSLFHYLMARRGSEDGTNTYVELMTTVDTLTRMGETAKGVHLLTAASGTHTCSTPLVDDICA